MRKLDSFGAKKISDIDNVLNSVYKYKILKDINFESGFVFFIKIPINNELTKVFITDSNIIDIQLITEGNKTMKIYKNLNEKDILIKEGIELSLMKRQIYVFQSVNDKDLKNMFPEIGITIIEIKDEDNINDIFYYDIDDLNNLNASNPGKCIFVYSPKYIKLSILNTPIERVISFSDKKFTIKYEKNSDVVPGLPIILSESAKVIGITKGSLESEDYNYGVLICSIIQYINDLLKIKKYDEYIKEKMFPFFMNEIIIYDEDDIKRVCSLHFLNLSELKIKMKKKVNINFFENDVFQKLINLSLENCKIENINEFEKACFRGLIKINLDNTHLNNLKLLNCLSFSNLLVLSANKNKIINIDILRQENFYGLKIIRLNNNLITEIKYLEKLKCIEELDLANNNIQDIDVLQQINVSNLKILKLDNNKIKTTRFFENLKFKNLLLLSLNNIGLNNIEFLLNPNLINLNELYLESNNIVEIDSFKNTKFTEIRKICLANNLITNFNPFSHANFTHLLYISVKQRCDNNVINYFNKIFSKIMRNTYENLGHNLVINID